MSLSIVISTYGRFVEIKNLINSIHESFPENFYEIIIVSSDNPDSEKVSWLKKQRNTMVINPDIRTGSREKSLYYYENIGLKEAKKDYVLIINDDMFFDKNFYEEFIKIKNYDIIFFKTHLGSTRLGMRTSVIGNYITPKTNEYKNLYLADFILCKKEVYEKIGPLDENIDWFGIGADLALSFAFSKHDFDINYENNLYLNHLISDTDRVSESDNARTYHIYIEKKWRNFCKENDGYDFKINW